MYDKKTMGQTYCVSMYWFGRRELACCLEKSIAGVALLDVANMGFGDGQICVQIQLLCISCVIRARNECHYSTKTKLLESANVRLIGTNNIKVTPVLHFSRT
jgi:hypothetical protein